MIENPIDTLLKIMDYSEILLNINESMYEIKQFINKKDITALDYRMIEQKHKNIIDRIVKILAVDKNFPNYVKTNTGIIQLKENIPYLETEIQKIVLNYLELLDTIRYVRNKKCEHEIHNMYTVNLLREKEQSRFNYVYKHTDVYKINTIELERLIEDINVLFDKIYSDINFQKNYRIGNKK